MTLGDATNTNAPEGTLSRTSDKSMNHHHRSSVTHTMDNICQVVGWPSYPCCQLITLYTTVSVPFTAADLRSPTPKVGSKLQHTLKPWNNITARSYNCCCRGKLYYIFGARAQACFVTYPARNAHTPDDTSSVACLTLPTLPCVSTLSHQWHFFFGGGYCS
jgi:hypothetical protein